MTMVLFRGIHPERATPNWTPVASALGRRPQDPRQRSVLIWVTEAWQRRRTRAYLWQLDDRMLKDIGVTRAEAGCEASKPFWFP